MDFEVLISLLTAKATSSVTVIQSSFLRLHSLLKSLHCNRMANYTWNMSEYNVVNLSSPAFLLFRLFSVYFYMACKSLYACAPYIIVTCAHCDIGIRICACGRQHMLTHLLICAEDVHSLVLSLWLVIYRRGTVF